jgi:hypothetical protein
LTLTWLAVQFHQGSFFRSGQHCIEMTLAILPYRGRTSDHAGIYQMWWYQRLPCIRIVLEPVGY